MSRSPPQPKLILVIDDEPSVLRVSERILKRAGYFVLTARSCSDAMDTLEQSPVDLLIVDMFMPGRDGFETIQAARRRRPDVQVIAMSGGGTIGMGVNVLEHVKRLGADTSISKPFSSEELLEVVSETLQRVDHSPD